MAIFDCTNTNLKRNSSGEKVKTLQTHLKTLGYYNKAIDGEYGYYTEEAVKAFQKSQGTLKVDGWFGEVTCKKFNAAVEARQQTQNNNTQTQNNEKKEAYPFDCPNTELKRGSSDKEKVKKLQEILRDLKLYTREVDGDFGKYTEDAVKAYQKTQSNLLVDGIFGPVTCKKMAETFKTLYPNSKNYVDPLNVVAPLTDLPKTPPYSKLVIHPEVVVLPESEIQVSTSTDSTGNKVASTSVKLGGGSIDATTNFDCSKISLKKGSQGDDVKKLQTILKARGYYTKAIDGDFGNYTVAAVKRLQQAQGNEADGWFGQKTCSKLQSTSSTSSTDTGTQDKKNVDYVIDDWSNNPSFTDDMEGISHELTLKTPYTPGKLSHMRKLQKTTFTMKQEDLELYKHQGYINEIKISNEDNEVFIEMSITGYTVFLNQTIENYEKTAKRSELLKELIKMAGLKPEVDLSGLDDSEYTIKAQKMQTTTGEGSGSLTQLSGNDCEGGAMHTNRLSAFSKDIDKCGGNTKIGNSSANYAVDTAHMSAKEAIKDLFNRFKYPARGYNDNQVCPQKAWKKTGTISVNCADISRLVKCVGEVHGLKVGITHCVGSRGGHYYNLIEVNGKVYRFDCCFGSSGFCSGYGDEVCNNLTKRGGPWQ